MLGASTRGPGREGVKTTRRTTRGLWREWVKTTRRTTRGPWREWVKIARSEHALWFKGAV